jgi:hypothetical protein
MDASFFVDIAQNTKMANGKPDGTIVVNERYIKCGKCRTTIALHDCRRKRDFVSHYSRCSHRITSIADWKGFTVSVDV